LPCRTQNAIKEIPAPWSPEDVPTRMIRLRSSSTGRTGSGPPRGGRAAAGIGRCADRRAAAACAAARTGAGRRTCTGAARRARAEGPRGDRPRPRCHLGGACLGPGVTDRVDEPVRQRRRGLLDLQRSSGGDLVQLGAGQACTVGDVELLGHGWPVRVGGSGRRSRAPRDATPRGTARPRPAPSSSSPMVPVTLWALRSRRAAGHSRNVTPGDWWAGSRAVAVRRPRRSVTGQPSSPCSSATAPPPASESSAGTAHHPPHCARLDQPSRAAARSTRRHRPYRRAGRQAARSGPASSLS
jgi:hypothetical protein